MAFPASVVNSGENVTAADGNATVAMDGRAAAATDGHAVVAPFGPRFFRDELTIETEGSCGFHDITDDLTSFVTGCGLDFGMVVLLSLHTTAGLLINEHETGFRTDFREVAERIAPSTHEYMHDDLSVRFENLCPEDREFPNGHAHLQQSVIGAPSLVIPVHESAPVLGRWQRVFLIEFDRPRVRRVAIHGLGFAGAGAQQPSHA